MNLQRQLILKVAVGCFTSAAVFHAQAAGFYISEVGTPGSLGTAGVANTVNTYSADAAWTNPAGMTGLKEDEMLTGFQIHIIIAGTTQGDQLYSQCGKFVYHLFFQVVIYKHTDDIIAGSQGSCLHTQTSIKILNVVIFIPFIKNRTKVWLCVKKSDSGTLVQIM